MEWGFLNPALREKTEILVVVTIFASERTIGHRMCQFPAILGSIMIILANYFEFKSERMVQLFTGTYCLSILMCFAFSDMDFSQVIDTGKYSVGFQEFHIGEGEKQAVSMYYPIAKFSPKIPASFLEKSWLSYTKNDNFLIGLGTVLKWRFKSSWVLPTFLFKTLNTVKMQNILTNARLSQDFDPNFPGSRKCVPIVFSHGLGSCRDQYTVCATELASHGYIVFLLDHHDGTCIYTETKSGDPIWFDHSTPW